MDNRVNNIKNIIYQRKNNYPNISKIWLKYIDELIKHLNNTLNKAEKVFDDLNDDMSMESISLLYLLYNNNEYI
tara:strand:- start:1249 stop:1470 length:222 start_codon:yes stop_codon:yes gene_type:complete